VRPLANRGRQQSLPTTILFRSVRCPRIQVRLLDRILTAVLAALVVFTPFAIGSVHPWAFTLMEVAVFCLLILWAMRVTVDADAVAEPVSEIASFRSRSLLLPASIFAALVVLQLLPLPPVLVRFLSPSTYQVFVHALPGWPRTAPYAEDAFSTDVASGAASDSASIILPTVEQVRQGVAVPFANSTAGAGNKPKFATERPSHDENERRTRLPRNASLGFAENWYPLSIAPSLTEAALFKYAGYVGLFFLVLAYPFVDRAEGERRFYRTMLATVVVTSLLVAVVGLAERVYWNGKILWFVVPQDWGAPWPGVFPRATGPFVDPDHFANYLSMAFPLVLAGAFYGFSSASIQRSNAFRLLCVIATFIIFLAIALSLSRAGWIEATTAGLFFSLICFNRWLEDSKAHIQTNIPGRHRTATSIDHGPFEAHHSKAVSQRLLFRFSKTAALGLSLVVFLAVVIFALFLMGPVGRTQADIRIGDTISSGGGIGARPTVWKDTLRMIRDFPVFGVGLGGWPEIFPRYESAPWSPYYFREVHNDYLQYAAETGLVGILALVWFCSLIAAKGHAALRRFSATERPLFIALGLAVVVMALHELVDFCLRIPANAFLFTLLLAIAVRMAVTKTQGVKRRGIRRRFAAGCMVAASAVFIVLALGQNGLPYPYDIEQPSSPVQARALVLAHPASAQAHLDLLLLTGQNMPPTTRLDEIEAAVFVDPTNPHLRDLYAQKLALAGKQTAALEQVAQSVFNSPTLGTHFYLSKWISLLSSPEQHAVEHGFKEAVAARYPGAVDEFGAFDEVFGRFSAEARLFISAARDASSDGERARYLVGAGEAEIRAGNNDSAENLFRQAIQAAPSNQAPYQALITRIYGPAKKLSAAQAVTDEGIRNGVDPLSLYPALSAAAQADGNQTVAEGALLKALAYQPTFEMYMQIGQFYLQSQKLDRAVSMLQNATEINPASADGFYSLAVAQERDYQYSEADKNYARAASLAPLQFHSAFVAFHHRVDTTGSSR
jgi:O-antigen ligase/tetratricopeptide (TPR) repeat protein